MAKRGTRLNMNPVENKKSYSKRCPLLLALFLMWLTGACTAAKLTPEDVFELEDKHGLSYKKTEHQGQTAHVLRVDPSRCKIVLLKAEGLERPSDLAKRNGGIVAINGGFFKKNGDPAGVLKIDGTWINYPKKNRGVIGWKTVGNKTKFYFDRLGPELREEGMTSHRDEDDEISAPWWQKAESIVGGAPLLIHEGKIVDPEPEKTLDTFLQRKYARTAIGIDDDQKLVLVVIEGGDGFAWKLGLRYGMRIHELANFMQALGCTHALNLDGGGSSTMIVKQTMVNTQLRISGEREVSDIIMIK